MKKKKGILVILLLLIILFFLIFNHVSKKKTISPKKNIHSTKQEVYQDIPFYKESLKNRYQKYKDENADLSLKDIVTRVNIGLDYSFYTHTKKTPYLNKDYILVNKYLYLGEDYIPDSLEDISTNYSRSGMKLVSSAKEAFEDMAKKALDDDIHIIAMSSYRSYQYQVRLYNNYVKSDGVSGADTYSARPGFSEHQTGLCVDIYDGVLDYTNFENSNSFLWMQENAHKYGFILRYPKNKENITGYQYESWHYRYVGKKIATYIHKNNITFDEYYAQKLEGKN